ncbi:MAG: hypothetical protein R3F30_03580 [Planctomycetota bacterium]
MKRPTRSQERRRAAARPAAATTTSASPWSSKDKVASEEDEELAEDEDVDEDDEEEDARGGMQPMLRDRRPPVNRDLSIGFGNQKNPDANGRGGPGERRSPVGSPRWCSACRSPTTSRAGPTPGRSRSPRERVPPSAEAAPALDAEGAPAATGASGRWPGLLEAVDERRSCAAGSWTGAGPADPFREE